MGRTIPISYGCCTHRINATHSAWFIRVSPSHEPSLPLKILISPNPGIVPISFNFVEMWENSANHTTKALWTRMPNKVRIKGVWGQGEWAGIILTWSFTWNLRQTPLHVSFFIREKQSKEYLLFRLHTFVSENQIMCLVNDESVKYNS